MAQVFRRAVASRQLEGRPDRAQFEILSADYMVDEDFNVRRAFRSMGERTGRTTGLVAKCIFESCKMLEVFLLEFNMSPVLKDPKDSPETNDGAMIEAALGIVFPDGPDRTGRGPP